MTPDRDSLPFGLWRTAARSAREHAWSLERQVDVLETERRDLRRILNGLGEGVLAVDRAGVVVHANPAAVELLGLDTDATLGSHMFVAVPHPGVCDAIEDVMRSSERTRSVREIAIDRPDGEKTLTVSIRPLRTAGIEDGEPEGAIAVVRDVTDLRRLERARQDFFTNVSHELKTPITAIRGSLETVLDDAEMPEDVRARFLDGARTHSIRLGSLVNDLLALARLEDPNALQRRPVNLVELAREVVTAVEAEGRGRDVRIELDAAPDIPQVLADEEAIRQALTNLVGNAVGHSEAGGIVHLAVRHGDGVVDIVVTDTGGGIPVEALDRIFERFYRVDAARSRARGGTGIGLSIVKHVAQSHGGNIMVTSEVGAGSQFTLQLPVSPIASHGT